MPRGTTPFVRKTWELLSDSELGNVVAWNRNGETFAILDADTFSTNVLPQYFKHSNLCSFVRQLNTYGFKKVTSKDCKELEFKHKLFHRDHEELLPHIVRRTATSKSSSGEEKEGTTGTLRREDLLHQLVETNKQLVERLNELKEQQLAADAELCAMRRELNETRSFVNRMNYQWKMDLPPPPSHRVARAVQPPLVSSVSIEKQSGFGFDTSPTTSGASSPETQPNLANTSFADNLPLNGNLDFEDDFFSSL